MKRPIITVVVALVAASPVHAQWSARPVPVTAAVSMAVHSPVRSHNESSQSLAVSYALLLGRAIPRATPTVMLPAALIRAGQERFNLKWPLIGAAIGAAAGYWYAERHQVSDTHFPPHIYSIPLGALGGFVVGIMTEHIIVTVGNSEAERSAR